MRSIVLAGLAGLAAVLAGCIKPNFTLQPRELKNMSYPVAWARLSGDRTITQKGVFIFVKAGRESPAVYARSLLVGAEGVCLASGYSLANFWRAVRLDFVDDRIASRVIQPRAGVELSKTGEQSWEARGAEDALRAWLDQHLRAAHDAQRSFVDLPAIAYATETVRGWTSHDAEALRRLIKKPGIFESSPEILVGWTWDEIDRIDYYVYWPDSEPSTQEIDKAIRENDHHIGKAIDDRSGLPPGPCPVTQPKPLLIK